MRTLYEGALRGVLLTAGLLAGLCAHAADMRIVNLDGASEGLNDPTPAEPVGGNDGETLGARRRIALQYAADILGSRIASSVTVRIAARFDRLQCSRTGAPLAQTAPAQFTTGFAGAQRPNTFYPVALANAMAGQRIARNTNDIDTTFNASLDDGDRRCLQGAQWYYGLDGDAPPDEIPFIDTAVHELIHGLGFLSLVALTDTSNTDAGQFPQASDGRRLPDIYSRLIKDLSLPGQPLWPELSAEQRADSITNGPDVVFADSNTANGAASVLVTGFNQGYVKLYAPASVQPGSSISHWDTSLSPDQLMEPAFTGQGGVQNGIGLSACVLQAIGWRLINGARCPDTNTRTIAGGRDTAVSDPGPAQTSTDSAASADSGGSDGGGGCTLDPDAPFDPLWLVMLGAAGAVIAGRRRRV